MKFKATSYGVNLGPDDGTTKNWSIFCTSEEEAVERAREFLRTLSPKQQEEGYVLVVEIAEILRAEIHTAKEKGQDGQLIFAIAKP